VVSTSGENLLGNTYHFIESDLNCFGFGSLVFCYENKYAKSFRVYLRRELFEIKYYRPYISAHKYIKQGSLEDL